MDLKELTPWHIGYIVSSVDETVESMSCIPGIGEWEISCGDPPPGSEGDLDPIKCAYVNLNGTLIELVEPLTSNGFFAKELNRRGSGPHHFAYVVPDGKYFEFVKELLNKGWTKPYYTIIENIESCMVVSPDGSTILQLAEKRPH